MRSHGTRLTRCERRRSPGIIRPMTDEERLAEEAWQTEALIGMLNNPFIAEGAEGRLRPNVTPSERAHIETMRAEERADVAEILALLEAGEERVRQAREQSTPSTDEGRQHGEERE